LSKTAANAGSAFDAASGDIRISRLRKATSDWRKSSDSLNVFDSLNRLEPSNALEISRRAEAPIVADGRRGCDRNDADGRKPDDSLGAAADVNGLDGVNVPVSGGLSVQQDTAVKAGQASIIIWQREYELVDPIRLFSPKVQMSSLGGAWNQQPVTRNLLDTAPSITRSRLSVLSRKMHFSTFIPRPVPYRTPFPELMMFS
jgi:hypothetical protein